MVTGAEAAADRNANVLTSAPVRVGIFGGTFDPPHLGHLSAARDVADLLALDEVVWVPASHSPLKPDAPATPSDLRLEMVRRTIEDEPRFRVDDCELRRSGRSFTVDTLREMRAGSLAGAREIVLIIGTDQYASFDRWKEPDTIRSLASIGVMDREGVMADETSGIRRLPVGRVDISASVVRDRVARGASLDGWVTPGVARLIAREGLYA